MKNILLLISFVFLLSFWNVSVSQNVNQFENTKISFTTQLPDSLKQVIETTVKLFSDQYGFIPVLVISEDTLSEDAVSISASNDGLVEGTLAYSLSGKIFLNKRLPITCDGLRKIIEHELFHSLFPKSLAIEPKPFLVPMVEKKETISYVVKGYLGLSVIVWNSHSDEISKIGFIEEAAAEVCAGNMESGHESYDSSKLPSYNYLRSFLNIAVDSQWVSPQQLVLMQKTNGVKKLCAVLLAKDEKRINGQDLLFILNCFEKVSNSTGNYLPVFDELYQKRKANLILKAKSNR